ncbi:hypothetical protein DsansV1_C14g0128401 [Dioscorea sansibarensis]
MEGNWGWRASVVSVRGEALQEAALQKKRKLQLKRLTNQAHEADLTVARVDDSPLQSTELATPDPPGLGCLLSFHRYAFHCRSLHLHCHLSFFIP